MTPATPAYALRRGDVLQVLRTLPDNCADGCLTDPPYGFKFMGKKWDYDVPSPEVWREVLRVLKPGAAILSFGGPRTYHRVACALEDAGAELRDQLLWVFGKGFPKSRNIALDLDKRAGAVRPVIGERTLQGNAAASIKEKGGTYTSVGQDFSGRSKVVPITRAASPDAQLWEGYGTNLKPAYEPIALARKPLEGTIVDNVLKWGVGGLAIDACRVGSDPVTINRFTDGAKPFGDGAGHPYESVESAGRWPTNLILDDTAAAYLDAQVGDRPSRKSVTRNGGGNHGGAVFEGRTPKARPDSGYTDSGGPSRFFPRAGFTEEELEELRFHYSAKVSKKEREQGCEALPVKSAGEMTEREDGQAGLDNPRAGAGRTGGAHNHHPTLKPIALNRWLASLIRPPRGGVLLVPYAGSGSEMIGGMLAGWPNVFGIEGEADYVAIAHARIASWVIGAVAA